MFALLWVAGLIAFYFSWRSREKLRGTGAVTGFRSIVATQLTEILGIYLAAGALFLGIAFWANATGSSDSTLRVLWDCQNKLKWIALAVGKIKAPSQAGTVILVALALLAWFYESEPAEVLWEWFSRYQRAMKRLALATTALASFTFFSGTLDEGRAKINLEIHKASDHYAAYVAELEDTAMQSATASVIQRVSASVPPQWNTVSARQVEIETRAAELQRVIESLASEHGVNFGSVRASDFHSGAARKEQVASQTRQSEPASRTPSREPSSKPQEAAPQEAGGFSEGRLVRLRSNLNAARGSIWASSADFLETHLGSKVPDALVGNLLSHSHWQALRLAGQENPLLEALLGIVDKAIAGRVAERLKQEVLRLARDGDAADPAADLARAAESLEPIEWSRATAVIGRAEQQSRAELGQIDTALEACKEIETKAIADEAAAFRAREESLIAKWREIAGEDRPVMATFDLVTKVPGADTESAPAGRAASEPMDERHSLFARYRNLLPGHSEAAEEFVASLHEKSVSQDRREAAMKDAEEVVAGGGTVAEKAAALEKLTFRSSREDLTARMWGRPLFGGFESEFTATYENAWEREARLRQEKFENDWRRRDEDRKMHELERARFKQEFGYEMEEIEGIRSVKGIRIGKWELPRIPWRALRGVRIP